MKTTALLEKILSGQDLTAQEAERFLGGVMDESISSVQLAALLPVLRMKGESPAEILGLIRAMRRKMITLDAPDAMDVCGTGGDGLSTFNISTTVAFVVAGAGVTVAKHGNRAASSKSGSADVLEALGVNIDLSPESAAKVLQKTGIVFLFAQKYHPALKQVAAVRRELGIRTVFNSLGPFANPAGTKTQLIGVADPAMAEKLAQVAAKLAYKRVLIINSADGLDEAGLSAPTSVYDVSGNKVARYVINPTDYGFAQAPLDALQAGEAAENADILKSILAGQKGPKRDIVVLNSALALLAAGKADSIRSGLELAAKSIDSGAALAKLERLIKEASHA